MYHGISAYNRTNKVLELVRRADAIAHGEAGTICCADKPIGPVGVFVDGVCPVAFVGDVWSTLEDCAVGRGFSSDWRLRHSDLGGIAYHEGSDCLNLWKSEYNYETQNDEWFITESISIDASANLTDSEIENVSKESEELGNNYAEYWFHSTRVTAVWLSADASPWWQKVARILARRYDVPLMRVTGRRLEWRQENLPEDQDFGPYDLYEEAV
jgi:hypothetical protein